MVQKFTCGLKNDCRTVIEVSNFREYYIIVCRLNLFNKMTKMAKIPPIAPLNNWNKLKCIHCAHSPTFLSLHLCHISFSNLSVTSPMSQLILKPFPRFTYVTTHSPTLPLLHLRHSSFSNHSFASPSHKLFT